MGGGGGGVIEEEGERQYVVHSRIPISKIHTHTHTEGL